MSNVRLKRYVSFVGHSLDAVEIRFGGTWSQESYVLRDEEASGILFKIVSGLTGELTTDQLARSLAIKTSAVESVVDQLTSLGAIEVSATSALDFYLNAFGYNLRSGESTPDLKPVLLIGPAELQAALVTLIKDVIPSLTTNSVPPDESRWLALCQDDSWQYDGLRREQMMQTLHDWKNHVIVYCSHIFNPLELRALNCLALHFSIPWIHSVMDGPFLLIGPFMVPGQTPCFRCLETRLLMNKRGEKDYQAYKNALANHMYIEGQIPAKAILESILTAHTALETLNFLTTGSSFLVGKMLAVHLPTMEFSYNDVLRVPGCDACAGVNGRDDRELYFDMTNVLSVNEQ